MSFLDFDGLSLVGLSNYVGSPFFASLMTSSTIVYSLILMQMQNNLLLGLTWFNSYSYS